MMSVEVLLDTTPYPEKLATIYFCPQLTTLLCETFLLINRHAAELSESELPSRHARLSHLKDVIQCTCQWISVGSDHYCCPIISEFVIKYSSQWFHHAHRYGSHAVEVHVVGCFIIAPLEIYC